MRLIGTLSTESDARRFCDYLLTVSMPAHVEEGSDGAWQVWVEHDDHLDAATNELHAYTANPNDPKYATVHLTAKKLRDSAGKKAARRQAQFTDVRTTWARGASGEYATPISAFLIGAAMLITLGTGFGQSESSNAIWLMDKLLFQARPVNGVFNGMFASIRAGEVWRLVTPIFLHFDVTHILFNALFMWRFGVIIESRKGSLFFTGLVLISAMLSCSAEALWTTHGWSPRPWAAFGGLSGVNYALFGYAWVRGHLAPREGIAAAPFDVGLMLTWLVLCMFTTFVGQQSVANAAHLGGLVTGCAIAFLPRIFRKLRR
ncbi:MAG: rhomboid family intramembrane serine protease [Tepidisphaeraceae bacterium]